ncbi:N-terminal nucleophile aminohydrolase [Aureobasidium pullulans]|nr:N-terminal nucleophile aminohydrolase [Aureobasidium pullulans]
MLHSRIHKIQKNGAHQPCIFVHAGAGYHSVQNEKAHLKACEDAAKAAMAILRTGGTAMDAVEISVKVLEDREITNSGYGSNLAIDGVVECDATIVDHYGRSGAVGAVSQIKNPISLARVLLDRSTHLLSLRRVPPNLLVGQGAIEFAASADMPILPYDALVSPAAKDRWKKWKADLNTVEEKSRKSSAAQTKLSSSANATPSSQYLTFDPEHRVREQIRRAHTRALEAGVWNEAQPITPLPSSDSLTLPPPVSRVSYNGMPANNRNMNGLPDPSPMIYTDPYGPPGPRYIFGNAPMTNGGYGNAPMANSGRRLNDGHYSGANFSFADTMDIDDIQGLSGGIYGSRYSDRHDGSSADSELELESSSASSESLQLPSITPSPELEPMPESLLPALEAIDVELPESDEALESPSTDHSATLSPESNYPPPPLPPTPHIDKEDYITDTVGAVAIDSYGNIACGASSGGIGMKHRGRVGPAALVGVGSAVIPVDIDDKDRNCVAAVTSGTGEHMATTMASTVVAERLFSNVKKTKTGIVQTDESDAIKSFIENDFLGHPSVKHSHSAGAIGILAVKRTRDGIYLHFAHNTDSFALASMHGGEQKPVGTMSRSAGNGSIAQGGRAVRLKPGKKST